MPSKLVHHSQHHTNMGGSSTNAFTIMARFSLGLLWQHVIQSKKIMHQERQVDSGGCLALHHDAVQAGPVPSR